MADKKKNPGKTPRPAPGASGGAGPMDVGLLEQIVRLMADNDLSTVDLRDGDRRVILKRGQQVVSLPGMPSPVAMPAAAPGGAPAAPGGAAAGGASNESDLVPIRSPMVGTFYAAGKPG